MPYPPAYKEVRMLSVGFDTVVGLQPLQRYLCIHGFGLDPEICECSLCSFPHEDFDTAGLSNQIVSLL